MIAPPEVMAAGQAVLRAWQPGDAAFLAHCSQDPDIQRWTPVPHGGVSTEHAADLIDRWRAGAPEVAIHRVILAPDPVGYCSAFIRDDPQAYELAYVLLPEARGRGLATAAAQALIDWLAGAAGRRRFELCTGLGNHASEAVATRLGFRADGTTVRPLRGEDVVLTRWTLRLPDETVRDSLG